MKFITNDELRELVDFQSIHEDLLLEGFKLASREGGGSRFTHLFTNIDDLVKDSENHAITNGWDPDTTLVLYSPPPTEEDRAASAERTRKAIEEDPDWGDIQIGYVDPKQVVASIYKDMTAEKLVRLLTAPFNLKVFR